MSVIKTRGHHLFPVLDGTQVDTAEHFASGPERKFAPGEIVYNAGERCANLARAQGVNGCSTSRWP
jgi:thioredoxin reductase (NADPH)